MDLAGRTRAFLAALSGGGDVLAFLREDVAIEWQGLGGRILGRDTFLAAWLARTEKDGPSGMVLEDLAVLRNVVFAQCRITAGAHGPGSDGERALLIFSWAQDGRLVHVTAHVGDRPDRSA